MMDIPYFMTNKEWYRNILEENGEFDETGRGYILTDKAPPKAIESYNEFYNDDNLAGEDGEYYRIHK